MFENVLNGVLILDNEANCLDANPAAASILRVPKSDLIGKNIRAFCAKCDNFAQVWKGCLQRTGHRNRAELVAGDGDTVLVDFATATNYLAERHLLIFSDATERTKAERALRESQESARAEAEALLKATLALSQNLPMDSLLDTLLQCIGELVPFDRASVLFVEDAAHLMVAREADRHEVSRAGFVLSASESVYLQEILFERKPVFLSNTDTESDWIDAVPFDGARSWMGIPLTAAGDIIGILSFCAYQPAVFTTEHLRLARNLAVSAAVAIQNARVHERAAIYASELELRIRELHVTQGLLEQFRKNSFQ